MCDSYHLPGAGMSHIYRHVSSHVLQNDSPQVCKTPSSCRSDCEYPRTCACTVNLPAAIVVSLDMLLRCVDAVPATVLSLLLISQAPGSVLASDTKTSPTDRANFVFDFLAFGKHHRHSRKSFCEQTNWRKQSLKLIKEIPFAGLFTDLLGESKFEASGLVHINSSYYVVFDRFG